MSEDAESATAGEKDVGAGAAESAGIESRLGHTTGVVLCPPGGTPVHALKVGPWTLAERTAMLLAEICTRVVWLGARPPAGAPGSAAKDIDPGETEVSALAAALEVAEGTHVLVLAADRPLLVPDLVIGLAGLPDAPAAIPRDARGLPHPTCARYRRSLAGGLRAAAEAGARAIVDVLAEDDVRWLEGPSLAALDPDARALVRVSDTASFESLVAAHPTLGEGAWPGHPGLGLGRKTHGSGTG